VANTKGAKHEASVSLSAFNQNKYENPFNNNPLSKIGNISTDVGKIEH